MKKNITKIILLASLISLFFIPSIKNTFVYGAGPATIEIINITEKSATVNFVNVKSVHSMQVFLDSNKISNYGSDLIGTDNSVNLVNLAKDPIVPTEYKITATVTNLNGVVELLEKTFTTKSGPCTVTDAYFADFSSTRIGPMMMKDWFKDDPTTRPKIKIIINTNNCIGNTIQFYIVQGINGDVDTTCIAGNDNEQSATINGDKVTWCLDSTLKKYKIIQDSNLVYTNRSIPIDANTKSFDILPGETGCNDGNICNPNEKHVDRCECDISLLTTDQQKDRENKVWTSNDPVCWNNLMCYMCDKSLDEYGNPIKLNAFGMPVDVSFETCTASWGTNINAGSNDIMTKEEDYTFLAPIPGFPETIDTNTQTFSTYFNALFKVAIGIAGVLAVLMIIFAGIQYMLADATPFKKETAKNQISNAIIGLILLLGSVFMINLIDPSILNLGFPNVGTATLNVQQNSMAERNMNDTVRCVPVSSGPCSTENLSKLCFSSKSSNASKICNIESGGNPSAKSGTDHCRGDQTIFSFGLMQINLLANGTYIKDSKGNSCAGLFTKADGSQLVSDSGSVGNYWDATTRTYDCKLKPGADIKTRYEDCKNVLLTASKNLEIACTLYKQGTGSNNFTPAWNGDKKVCPSAFQ